MSGPDPSSVIDAAELIQLGYERLASSNRHGLTMPRMQSIDAQLDREAEER